MARQHSISHLHLRAVDKCCSICNETLGHTRYDGTSETLFILPCSHTFGSICISRWLHESPNHDCPHCRRVMVYRVCGHLIKPCDITQAPKYVSVMDMPLKCMVCTVEGWLEQELRKKNERKMLEESTLDGLSMEFPTEVGGICRSTTVSGGASIGEVRRAWGFDVDALCRAIMEEEGRKEW